MKTKILNNKLKSILICTVFSVGCMILVSNCNPDETQNVTNFNTISMQDEFDVDGAPNPAMWTYDIGTGNNGWGNNELQYYTDRPENVVVEDGMLKITAIQEDFEGSGYTSARLLTQGLFEQKYGRFEARMKLPYGKGMWPAFWLLGANIDEISWPFCGEIDVMENGGSKPTIVSGAVHGPGYSAGNAIVKEYEFTDSRVDSEFHIYGIEWGPNYINYYVDDVLYNQITPEDVTGDWVFNNGPFFMIINLAVGGVFDGNPNENTVFPQTMYVDYVRVYSAN
ncbi:MAG: glycoside hydrolase family 16 protein [Winogradskyella sp.]